MEKKKIFLNILYHASFFSILSRVQSLKLLSKQEFEACALDQNYIIFPLLHFQILILKK